jgi:uncharacterized protein YjbJ (UPF0337 family)
MEKLTEIKGNWSETKRKLKQKFAMLTDGDLLFAEGKKDEMFSRLQIKLGRTKEEIINLISKL